MAGVFETLMTHLLKSSNIKTEEREGAEGSLPVKKLHTHPQEGQIMAH